MYTNPSDAWEEDPYADDGGAMDSLMHRMEEEVFGPLLSA